MSALQESRPVLKMLPHRRALSRATTTVFTMLLMMVVVCQGQAGEVLVPLKNQTALVGEEAEFFCQIRGTTEQLWINKQLFSDNPRERPSGVKVVKSANSTERDELRVTNITITITASVERNNTEVACTDHILGFPGASYAYLTVRGGPAKPEVDYVLERDQKEILLSWPRPFSWKEYPVTGYGIECRDTESEKTIHSTTINDTETVNVVRQTVELPPGIPDCHTLQCSVTASNALDKSRPSISNISLPLQLKEDQANLSVTLLPLRFTPTSKPEAVLCVKLPVLCEFQTVRYRVVISIQGDPVLELSRQFSYSSGYASECIEEKVSGELEEGTEYEVQVFLYAGESGDFSSNKTSFKPELQKDKEFFQTDTGKIVAVAVATVLVIIILVLVTIIILSCRRRRSPRVVKAPLKRTTTPMVNNPIYDREADTHGPYYEQVSPLHLKRLNSTSSHSNLDSPGNRAPSPANSAITSVSTHPLYRNGGPASPTSVASTNLFSWPYAAVQHTNAATFDAIEADMENVSRLAASQTLPSCTPGEESYMTMQSASNNLKNNNVQSHPGQPRYAIDIHGNRYIEC